MTTTQTTTPTFAPTFEVYDTDRGRSLSAVSPEAGVTVRHLSHGDGSTPFLDVAVHVRALRYSMDRPDARVLPDNPNTIVWRLGDVTLFIDRNLADQLIASHVANIEPF